MAHIALITSEMAGRIQICCELGRRLETLGHTVVIGCPAPIGERVARNGLTYLDIEAPPADPVQPGRNPGLMGRLLALAARLATVTTITRRQEARAALLGVHEFADAMRSRRPDLVLIDLELGAHHLVARSMDLNAAGWTSMLSVWKRPGLPPLGSNIVPGRDTAGNRLGIELAWLTLRAGRLLRDLRLRITRIGEDRISVLRRVSGQLEVPFRQFADRWQWLVPFVPRHLPVLVFNARQLDLPHEPLSSVRYVGPMIAARPEQESNFLDPIVQARAAGEVAGIIYASFGAWDKGDDAGFLQRLIEVARGRPRWAIIVGLGGRRDPDEFGNVPSNLHLLAWAPQTAILEHADCAIHHAGISSINECLRAGVPMLVYPFDFLDQPGNAARIEFHGLGVQGDRDNDSPADISRRIEETIAGSFRDRVVAMGKALQELDESQSAVAAVTDLLGDGHQSASAS